MLIGGFCEFSLSDYPGHIAAVIFAQGCNFRCGFCHNGGLIPFQVDPQTLRNNSQIIDYLKKRRGQIDAVVITGGEPTLQKDLAEFISRIKTLGYLIKLDTNGSRPGVIRELIENNLVDYVAMDVKAPIDKYGLLVGRDLDTKPILESMAVVSESGLPHQFRTTNVTSLLVEDDIDEIKRMIPVGSPFTIQKFNPENAFDLALREGKAVG